MKEIIKQELIEIEQRENIRILFACESGSRAWGFPSADSDYDVRFIYIRPLEWYLSIDEQKDTLEFPINDLLDISGWDLRKMLKLFRASNAVVYEWLQSPIVYKQEEDFAQVMKNSFEDFFSLRAGLHHYTSMAMNVWENDLQSERVRLKKYFYALRPVLACQWTLQRKTVPPMELEKLRQLIEQDLKLKEILDDLLTQKLEACEKDTIPSIGLLQAFISKALQTANTQAALFGKTRGNTEVLDALFRKLVNYRKGCKRMFSHECKTSWGFLALFKPVFKNTLLSV